MIAAIAVLIKDATKLTLGQPLTILAPHTVESLIRQPPDRWLSNARLIHYQSLLQDTDRIQFGPVVTLNPATLLPTPGEAPLHDCHQILVETHGTRPDLTDQPMKDADLTWYTDGSSYLQVGERWAGAAITTDSQIVWASALPGGTSAQRAQLIALTQALQLAEVFLDTFSGWTEAFPTKKETANIVAKKLLEEIFPRPICELCSWCNKKSGNPWQPPTRKNLTSHRDPIPTKSGILSGSAGIEPRTLNLAGKDLILCS
ncbi:uncharacterized protein LOC132001424 isoform X1 [Mustela nigripes]|uniref:uncharacterized protein LOC132001424 isoform X1 n=1 Tax=Mustela nigripes TaxID=77151 RepID=UPI0028152053|nr:uncharacterized protein LOC132001424 isoform X1 [Mustela nigripes]